jgi:hypothetical protein
MNLSTTKKVIAIYRANRFFFLLSCLFSVAMAQTPTDLNSYCFDRSVNLRDVHQSLKILLLPKDIVEFRTEDNCLDILTSSDRGKLFEKYLSKRYSLKRDVGVSVSVEKENLTNKEPDCHLNLKTTKNVKLDTSNFKIGEKNVLNKGETINHSVSTTEFLLGAGKIGEIGIGDENLKVICQPIGSDSASLNFSFSEIKKAIVNSQVLVNSQVQINSQVLVKRGEWLDIASVLKDLNDKAIILGIPQTEMSQTKEKNETAYELQFK